MLQAHDNMDGFLMGPLPSEQWKREALFWESISLAALQIATVEVATGPWGNPFVQKYVQKTVPEVSGNQSCYPQVVRNAAYTSFSVLGLALTMALGGVIVLVANAVEPVCAFVQKRWSKRGRGTYRRLEWVTNEALQLQRMVHEELGLGTWTGTAQEIPVTGGDETLGVLDVSDEKHPIMRNTSH